MRISAKLSNESSDSMLSDYGPPTPVVNYDPPTPITNSEEVFDSKTGIFVKREETEDHADQGKNFRIRQTRIKSFLMEHYYFYVFHFLYIFFRESD